MTEYRKATKEDIELLMSSRLEMLRTVNDLPDDYEYSEEIVSASRDYFLNGHQTTLLAMDGDKVIGCASMSYIRIMPTFSHPTGKRAHLMNVYTRNEYRRQGIARQMVEMLIRDARERGPYEIRHRDHRRRGRRHIDCLQPHSLQSFRGSSRQE